MEYPKVSVITLNWNGLEDTIECLESLKKITYPNYEVVVVDNGSDRDDADILQSRFKDCICVIRNDRNYGYGKGNNIGIKEALDRGADYILLLHNDTVVSPDFLHELTNVALSDAEIGIVGPKIYLYNEPTKIWYIGSNINLWSGLNHIEGAGQTDTGQFEETMEIGSTTGCCLLISRRVLSAIGLLDERFFAGREEDDFCLRARKSGFKVLFVPKSKIWHKEGRSTREGGKTKPFLTSYAVKSYFLFLEKHCNKLQFATAILCRLLLVPKIFPSPLQASNWSRTLRAYITGFLSYLRDKS